MDLNRDRIDYGRDVQVAGGMFITGTAEDNVRLDNRGRPYLTDAEYNKSLDRHVPTCVDLVLLCPGGQVLLGQRQQEPQPDWWVIGGAMYPRETFFMAAVRHAVRELGLRLDESRFDGEMLTALSLVWDTRAQEPVNAGCHTLSLSFLYRLTDEELSSIRHNAEYEALAPHRFDDVIGNSAFHPALQAMLIAAQKRIVG